jgi:hypothetical protein
VAGFETGSGSAIIASGFFVIPFPKTIGAVMADRAGLKNLNKTIGGVSA